MAPSTGSVSSIASRAQSHLPRPSTSRIDVLFGLYVTTMAGVACYCAYNFYKAYQVWQCPTKGLDDFMKQIKCRALLAEAKGKNGEEAKSILGQCEALVTSIDNSWGSGASEEIEQLAKRYAKDDPAHAYKLAGRLPRFGYLYMCNVALAIRKHHNDFDPAKLDALCTRALNAKFDLEALTKERRALKPENQLKSWLVLANKFHCVGSKESAAACLEKAEAVVDDVKNPTTRMESNCSIAKGWHAIERPDKMQAATKRALKTFNSSLSSARTDAIPAQFTLAETFLAIGDFTQLHLQLHALLSTLQEGYAQNISFVYRFASLIAEIQKLGKLDENQIEITRVQHVISSSTDTNHLFWKGISSEDKINAALSLANIYREKLLVEDADKLKALLDYVREEIGQLPHDLEGLRSQASGLSRLVGYYEQSSTEAVAILADRQAVIAKLPEDSTDDILKKISWQIKRLQGYKDAPDCAGEVFKQLKALYEKLPATSDDIRYSKTHEGEEIIKACNTIKLDTSSFFLAYLASFNEKDLVVHIASLAQASTHTSFTPEQQKEILKSAESLLPKITVAIDLKHALASIIRAYLKVDLEEGLRRLATYENTRAQLQTTFHLLTGVAVAAFVGLGQYYPRAASLAISAASLARLVLKVATLRLGA